MRPFCTNCGVFMWCAKTGSHLVTCNGNGEPYQLIMCDRYVCDRCGASIMTGYGNKPFKERYDSGFVELIAKLQASGEEVYFEVQGDG